MASSNNNTMWVTLIKHGFRNVRRGGLHFFFVAFMIGLGLYGLAAFGTVWLNFERLAQRVGSSVGAVAFLVVDNDDEAQRVAQEIAAIPGVAKADLVAPDAALQRAVGELDKNNALLVDAQGLKLPWVVEISRKLASDTSPLSALVPQVEKIKGVGQVMHAGAEVQRLERLAQVLKNVGLYLAILIALITIVVVGNTVKLTVLSRIDEISLMKLVGATDGFIRNPFLLEGFVQGCIGGGSAALGLFLSHQTLAGLLQATLSDAFGVFELEPLSLNAHLLLLLAGGLLGLLGAAFSLRRHLRS
ncbi:MAG: hypothetical protein CMH56_07080 [Myxococcales bacterium]|nr:hypothetical protein [Myxococcales bacterium]|tara:strand:+ start:1647 stop:2552 length:906 start_codon:yes stop_codon:yes gene_type:complete